LVVWTQDEAGPYTTVPCAGSSWQPGGHPATQPHEYIRDGTAKLLCLFHPQSGQVRVKGVTSSPNVVLHAWLKQELGTIIAALGEPAATLNAEENLARWESWRAGLTAQITMPRTLPQLRMLLVLDNLVGHTTPSLLGWLMEHGIMPLYTPLSGSWLNMAESMQRILKRRALDGQHHEHSAAIIASLEGVAAHWNQHPSAFEWGGRRQARRQRSRERRQRVGGSAAYIKSYSAEADASNNAYISA
jgi:hypothetical protein